MKKVCEYRTVYCVATFASQILTSEQVLEPISTIVKSLGVGTTDTINQFYLGRPYNTGRLFTIEQVLPDLQDLL